MRLRAHNLLCIQGFVGKGYSEAFVANMTRVVEALRPDALVTVLDRPDDLCAACPNLAASGCALHGPGTERGIVAQDRDVLRRLGLEAGERVAWGEVLARIRAHVRPQDLDAVCGTCPWLPLGHCKAGLRKLGCGSGAAPRGT
jgi:hypothetical protein